MGHNDDGNPTTDVKNRATLPGVGNESIVVPSNVTGGAPETVYTFGHYLRKMIHDVRQAGGVPLLSGMVPRMYWKGDVLQLDWPFADYTREVCVDENADWENCSNGYEAKSIYRWPRKKAWNISITQNMLGFAGRPSGRKMPPSLIIHWIIPIQVGQGQKVRFYG